MLGVARRLWLYLRLRLSSDVRLKLRLFLRLWPRRFDLQLRGGLYHPLALRRPVLRFRQLLDRLGLRRVRHLLDHRLQLGMLAGRRGGRLATGRRVIREYRFSLRPGLVGRNWLSVRMWLECRSPLHRGR